MPVRSGYMPVKKALRPGGATLHGDVVHEDRALVPDAVDVGRFADHQAAVVDARLHPADVVTHDEQDVGFLLFLGLDQRACQADGGSRRQQPDANS